MARSSRSRSLLLPAGLALGVLLGVLATRRKGLAAPLPSRPSRPHEVPLETGTATPAGPATPAPATPAPASPAPQTPAPATSADDVQTAYRLWQRAIADNAPPDEIALRHGQYVATYRALYGTDPVGSTPPAGS